MSAAVDPMRPSEVKSADWTKQVKSWAHTKRLDSMTIAAGTPAFCARHRQSGTRVAREGPIRVNPTPNSTLFALSEAGRRVEREYPVGRFQTGIFRYGEPGARAYGDC